MPPSRIVIVRHGERTDHMDRSFAKIFPRPHDPPLTPSGIEMGVRLGAYLVAAYQVDPTEVIVATSPLLRCVQTSDGVVRGLVGAGGAADAPPIYLELGLAEGAYWLFHDMQKNPDVVAPTAFHCPEPLFHSADYFKENTSKYVRTEKAFDLQADPEHYIQENELHEKDLHGRVKRGAAALLADPFFEGKTVVLTAHGETTVLWYNAITGNELSLSPAYTGFVYLLPSGADGAFVAQNDPFTTPHLPTVPSEH
ncbi:hypothetical protein STCU_00453 [Strigomonas culicis]|uniref:Uncharacterized protein n=1 Tax=Strigomonas culicis TaxID=28005 RepID=S9WL67_9TRYP|nr:hypothetical protein STCU_00453 [Strigomonas culicis]|eukprot:EPY36695.1 hypothetical protein STCU_00453 [Strigomonas culicis]